MGKITAFLTVQRETDLPFFLLHIIKLYPLNTVTLKVAPYDLKCITAGNKSINPEIRFWQNWPLIWQIRCSNQTHSGIFFSIVYDPTGRFSSRY